MKHWTKEDFNHWLYGLKDDDGHFAECAQCRSESERLLAIRKQITVEPEVAPEFLAAQRRAIYERLQQPRRRHAPMRWVMSLATVVLVVGLSIAFLRPRAPQPIYTHADEQLFSDLTSIEQTSEPRAIQPMHNLFEE